MHTDIVEMIRRLRTLADEPAEAPYDWAEFERRRQSVASRSSVGRNRFPAMAATVAAVAVIAGVVIVRSNQQRTPALARVHATFRAQALDRTGATTPITTPDPREQLRTRAIEGWLARLPDNPVVVRVGTHVAVTSLQDQIAELDDLMSAEQVAGVQPSRLDALARQRAQLVSSLAQLRYAEMLASATP